MKPTEFAVSTGAATTARERKIWEEEIIAFGGESGVRTENAEVVIVLRASAADVQDVRRMNETATIIAILPSEIPAGTADAVHDAGANFIYDPMGKEGARYTLDSLFR